MQHTDYAIGIDLGTTNSSVAYIHRKARGKQKSTIKLFAIPQLVKAKVIKERKTLSSFLYLPGKYDLPAGAIALPWDADRNFAVGEFARVQGQKVPERLIHSAKSWLCHSGVDRYAQILPWGGKNVSKLSPVESSARYLSFIKETWNHFKAKTPKECLEKQSIVLTVPAAFDEVARNLTLEAAGKAGLEHVILLEEPMAAFYHWIYSYHLKWPKKIGDDMLALVCDIGGGTTDFSLIEVKSEGTGFRFKRVAVGDHLLLGGDNMDLAVALHLEQTQARKKLDPSQFVRLVGGCRRSKEILWQKDAPGKCEFTVAGSGSSVVSGSIKFKVTAEILRKVVLEGFFPCIPWEKSTPKAPRAGFKEWGLPYQSEPAITSHLLSFLKKHLPQGKKTDLLLLNGGALIPDILRERIKKQLTLWFSKEKSWKPAALVNHRPNFAVAYGAAYYNMVRQGQGIGISGGSPRSFFLEVDSEGEKPKLICLFPFGGREGEVYEIDNTRMEATVGQPVAFSLYSSTIKKYERPGEMIEISDELRELAPIQTLLKVGKAAKKKRIAIKIQVEFSELGTLDLWLLAKDSDRRWRLQFQIRRPAPKKEVVKIPEKNLDEILAAAFSDKSSVPNTLARQLEKILGHKKERWVPSVSRKIWELLLKYAPKRALTCAHEARWLNLAGFCLRPGAGFPGDEWRIKQLWALAQEKIHSEKDIQCRVEWWVLWRRVAAGLNPHQQMDVFRQISYHLLPKGSNWRAKKTLVKRVKGLEMAEMWRTASSMEGLPVELRCELGKQIISRAQEGLKEHEFWALGRIGSRSLFHGHNVLPRDKVAPWIEKILQLDLMPVGLYTLAQMARKTGDRAIDIDESLRYRVLDLLKQRCQTPRLSHLYHMVEEITELSSSLQKHYLGDSLPPGLRILSKSKGEIW